MATSVEVASGPPSGPKRRNKRGCLTAQGSPRAIFRRAIECGNLAVAEMTLRAEIPRPTFVDLLELCGDEAMLPLHVLGKPDSVSEGTTDFALVVEAERLPATGWQVLHFYEQLMHVSLETACGKRCLPYVGRVREQIDSLGRLRSDLRTSARPT